MSFLAENQQGLGSHSNWLEVCGFALYGDREKEGERERERFSKG